MVVVYYCDRFDYSGTILHRRRFSNAFGQRFSTDVPNSQWFKICESDSWYDCFSTSHNTTWTWYSSYFHLPPSLLAYTHFRGPEGPQERAKSESWSIASLFIVRFAVFHRVTVIFKHIMLFSSTYPFLVRLDSPEAPPKLKKIRNVN